MSGAYGQKEGLGNVGIVGMALGVGENSLPELDGARFRYCQQTLRLFGCLL